MMATDEVVHHYNGYGGNTGPSSRRLDAPNVAHYGHPNGITPPPEYFQQQMNSKPPPYGQRQKQINSNANMQGKGPSFIRMMQPHPHQNMQSVHSASSQHPNQQRNHFGVGGMDSVYSSQSRRSQQRNMYSSQLPAQPQVPSAVVEMGAVNPNRNRRKSHK